MTTKKPQEKSLVEIVEDVLLGAIARGASTIRFSATPDKLYLLIQEKKGSAPFQETEKINLRLAQAIMARLKIMGGLSISEHNVVQTGTADMPFGKNSRKLKRPIRIICLPTIPGESNLKNEEIVIQIHGAE